MRFVLTLACSMSKYLLFLAVFFKLTFPTAFCICKMFKTLKNAVSTVQNILEINRRKTFETFYFKAVITLQFFDRQLYGGNVISFIL